MSAKDIPRKANRVLYLITVSLLLIFVRVWYLQTAAKTHHLKRARAPRERIYTKAPYRGVIFDRFGLPLAINQPQFNASVCYSPIRDIPYLQRIDGERVYARREYVSQLSHMLADELGLSAQDVEDKIYARAAIFPSNPYAIATDISEETFARLKMREHQFPGLVAQVSSKRLYPQGKIGSQVIGYLGSISDRQYSSVGQQLDELKQFLKAREDGVPMPLPKGYKNAKEVKQRYETLSQQAYSLNTMVGKGGIEQQYDHELRGLSGQAVVEVDVRGKTLRQLPGTHESIPGKTLTLSISAEMQAYAEQLLALTEKERDDNFYKAGVDHNCVNGPFVKGGAIVVMDPKSGELITCASYPNLDSNDFIAKTPQISQWLETQRYVSSIWDGIRPLSKEIYESGRYITLSQDLTWQTYLDMILSKSSSIKKSLQRIQTLGQAFEIQEAFDLLLHFSTCDSPRELVDLLYSQSGKQELLVRDGADNLMKRLDRILKSIEHNEDKLLLLDLLRLNANWQKQSLPIAQEIASIDMSTHRELNQATASLLANIKPHVQSFFHRHTFVKWREEHFQDYLKQKRIEERKKGTYAKPYLDYLLTEEKQQFDHFWKTMRFPLLSALVRNDQESLITDLHPYFEYLQQFDLPICKTLRNTLIQMPLQVCQAYLSTLLPHDELTDPLFGKYRLVKSEEGISQLKHLAAAFYPPSSFGYSKSHAYRQSTPPGSVFKIATAYAGLKEHFSDGIPRDANPLTLYDETRPGSILGHFLNGKQIPRLYKGGRLPRSHGYIGRVDLPSAMERSSNVYFSVMASDKLNSPLQLLNAAKELGYGCKTGVDLPGEYKGNLPTDLMDNRTGLYSFAIGQHAFDGTPLQTACMLAAVANRGKIIQPHVLKEIANPNLNDHATEGNYSYRDNLTGLGIGFSLFSKTDQQNAHETSVNIAPTLSRELVFPASMRHILLEGLHRVVNGEMGSARPNRIKGLYQHAGWMDAYKSVQHTLCGKTSTAEFYYHPTLDRESKTITCKHASFGGIAFEPNSPGFTEPELVVVVLLRFADYGKEAAPLAALMVKKWRELNQKYNR